MANGYNNQGLVWLALYGWVICAVLGAFLLISGALFAEDDANVLVIVGAVFLFVLAPIFSLVRFVMPRSWKRSLRRREHRRL